MCWSPNCAPTRAPKTLRIIFWPRPPSGCGATLIMREGWDLTSHGWGITAAGGDDIDFHETYDTGFLLARLENLWTRVPHYKPLRIGVVLLDLVPAARHQGDLFATSTRHPKLSTVIDQLNHRYGRNAVGFGLLPSTVRAFKGHAAFQARAGSVGILTIQAYRFLSHHYRLLGSGSPKAHILFITIMKT